MLAPLVKMLAPLVKMLAPSKDAGPTSKDADPKDAGPTSKDAGPTSKDADPKDAGPSSKDADPTSKDADPKDAGPSSKDADPTSKYADPKDAGPTSKDADHRRPLNRVEPTHGCPVPNNCQSGCHEPTNGLLPSEVEHSGDSDDEEAGTNELRELPSVPKKNKFYLNASEWSAIKPAEGSNKLVGKWTNLLSNKFSNVNKCCVLIFDYHWVKKNDSRKKSMKYCRVQALCKFKGCCRYDLTIRHEPKPKASKVKFSIVRTGEVIHNMGEVHKRHTRTEERQTIAGKLNIEGTSNYYYQQYAEMDEAAKLSGNINQPKTLNVLRKIKSDAQKECQLDTDMMQEVRIVQMFLRQQQKSTSGDSGFVKLFSVDPFKVHMYSNRQLLLYLEANKAQKGVLHFDATGSLIKKVPQQDSKRILLYSLVITNPVKGRVAIPVAEMISNTHYGTTVEHFLRSVIDSLSVLSKCYMPRRIETDLSWALLNSVVEGFNKECMAAYIERTWNVVHQHVNKSDITKFTYVHVCSAHMVQLVSRMLKEKIPSDKGLRKFVLYTFSLMINTTDLPSVRDLFSNLCIVLSSRRRTTKMERSLAALEACIKKQDATVQFTQDINDDNNVSPPDVDEGKIPPKTMREASPYYQDFIGIYTQVIDDTTRLDKDTKLTLNAYASPDVLKLILDRYMAIYPLWSGVLLGDLSRYDHQNPTTVTAAEETRSTNSCIENYFGNLKKDITPGRAQRLRPAHFISRQFNHINAMLNEIETVRGVSAKLSKKRGVPVKENWQPKSQPQAKRPLYFSPPKTMPTPKKTTSRPSSKDSGNHPQSTKISSPAWGGKIVYQGKTIHLDNTCPLDNMLFIFVQIYLEQVVSQWLDGNQSPLCILLNRIANLVHTKGEWVLAKIWWLTTFCAKKFSVGKAKIQTWNLYGSEFEMFVQHLGDLQGSSQRSQCSNKACPNPNRSRVTPDISLRYNTNRYYPSPIYS